jgi:uncharacterized membrane protein
VNPASRNLWLELVAIALLLVSLLLFLVAGYHLTMFVVHGLLPNEPPLKYAGTILGFREFLAGALATIVPAMALIATAWGLRSLLIDEREPDA